ncbi:MAG: ATP-binding cassette domain-containing protein [Candidatus Electryonea clarkiae]|nr:ATP-binding cassette domain-containing protein [Candidatus Electryonea clarkiae]MDP8286763.1 ATP-binding cassette domain-containing protein [Candidatus Electryonea clarkiae]
MNVIELEKVTKTFDKLVAVDDLSLAVPQGSIYGFIGPNGSGKTTTLRMIMNIFYPDSGSIRVFGKESQGSSNNRICYLPEERGLYKKMKVREILKFYGNLKNGKNLDKEIEFWLDALDLSEWADKKISTLSKGLSQKIQFIATVVSRPELLILDEPFTGLDPVNTDVIKDEVLKLQDRGTTIIFSTHDMGIAEKMCDFIFMIFKGKKVLDGTLSSIQDKYGSDTLRMSCKDGISALKDLDGVDKINDFGQTQELHMNGECDSQNVLSQIMSRTSVDSFEIARPSLHDIFVRIARPEHEEQH